MRNFIKVLDVAAALNTMLTAQSTVGETFSLPGPRTYTFEQLLHMTEALTLKKLRGPNFPKPLLALMSRMWDLVWWPTVSPDEVTRRYISDLPTKIGELGFKELGIEPDVLEDAAIVYLRRYRGASYADLPIQEGGIKLRKPVYHTLP